jgi:hypothetical protein
MNDALGHALFALDLLPDDPASLRRDDLPVLLAAIRGQRGHFEARRQALISALADADLDALRDLAADAEPFDLAFAALRPYRIQIDRMRGHTNFPPASNTNHIQ